MLFKEVGNIEIEQKVHFDNFPITREFWMKEQCGYSRPCGRKYNSFVLYCIVCLLTAQKVQNYTKYKAKNKVYSKQKVYY